ncbi:hypothetical protein N2152v2_010755 [Parachlorella kessleri]
MSTPFARWVAVWDAIMTLIDLTYTGFIVPISVAFSSTDSVDWLVGLDIAATVFYALDILMQLHAGFVLKGWDEKRQVLAIIAEAVLIGNGGGNVAWKLWYFLRMLRLLRLVRIIQVIWSVMLSFSTAGPVIMFYITTATIYGLGVLWVLFVIVNALGCFLWWLAELEGLENSWVSGPYITQPQLHQGLLSEATTPTKWLYSAYWALSAVTTAVYGDAVPTTVPEIITIMVYDFFSVFWWSAVVTLMFEVLQVVSRRARKSSYLLDRLNEVEGWMQERLLPPDLQQKVRRYYTQVWGPFMAGEDSDELSLLPAALRGEVVWRAAGATLCAVELLRCLPLEAIQYLATKADLVKLLAGHDLFSQGDDADESFYVLQAGQLAVLRGWKHVATAKAPAVVGQAALLPALRHGEDEDPAKAVVGKRAHTVRALTNCTLLKLRSEDVLMCLEEQPTAAAALCRTYLQASVHSHWPGLGSRRGKQLGGLGWAQMWAPVYLDGLLTHASMADLPPRAAPIRQALEDALSSQQPQQQQQQRQQEEQGRASTGAQNSTAGAAAADRERRGSVGDASGSANTDGSASATKGNGAAAARSIVQAPVTSSQSELSRWQVQYSGVLADADFPAGQHAQHSVAAWLEAAAASFMETDVAAAGGSPSQKQKHPSRRAVVSQEQQQQQQPAEHEQRQVAGLEEKQAHTWDPPAPGRGKAGRVSASVDARSRV